MKVIHTEYGDEMYEVVKTTMLCTNGRELAEYIYNNYDDINSINILGFSTFFSTTAWTIEVMDSIVLKTIDIRIATEEEKQLGKS